MKKISLLLVVLFFFSIGVNFALADVPTITDISSAVSTDTRTLTISVRHSGPSSIHYVSKLEVKVGEDVITVDLEPQTTTAFTKEVAVAIAGTVQVRAYCTLHGWSVWATLGEDTPDPSGDQPSGGVPGFSLISLFIGLTLLALLRRRGW